MTNLSAPQPLGLNWQRSLPSGQLANYVGIVYGQVYGSHATDGKDVVTCVGNGIADDMIVTPTEFMRAQYTGETMKSTFRLPRHELQCQYFLSLLKCRQITCIFEYPELCVLCRTSFIAICTLTCLSIPHAYFRVEANASQGILVAHRGLCCRRPSLMWMNNYSAK